MVKEGVDRSDPVRSGIEGLARFNRFVGTVGLWAGAVMIAVMTAIVILGVFFRYVLNNSISWVEDSSLILMVSMAFLVAPLAYRTGSNVAIEILSAMLPNRPTRIVRIVLNVLILWVVYRYFFESLALVERGQGIRVNTLPIPWSIPYLVVPVSMVALALAGVELLARDLWALMTGSGQLDLPHIAPQEPE